MNPKNIVTIKLLDAPNNNFVKVSTLGEAPKEEIFKLLEDSVKNNRVDKAIKISHDEISEKLGNYKEKNYIPNLTYTFVVKEEKHTKEIVKVVAPKYGINPRDEARLDKMCLQVVKVRHKANTQRLKKVLAGFVLTTGIIAGSIYGSIFALEQFDQAMVKDSYYHYLQSQKMIAHENSIREGTDLPPINSFGVELPKNTDEINKLYEIFNENLDEKEFDPAINNIIYKINNNVELTVDEMRTFLEYNSEEKKIFNQSLQEYNEAKEKGIVR